MTGVADGAGNAAGRTGAAALCKLCALLWTLRSDARSPLTSR